ncbi:MAG: MBL fold metallo-hydrolase [Actinomycetota bacterium]
MEIITLGTGSPIPSPDRAGPSTLVRAEGRTFLVDCGRGVQMRMAAAFASAPQLTAILLTHLHSDHVCDLNDLVTSRWTMTPFENPLTIIGPVGTKRFVELTLAMLEDDIGYRIAHHDDLTSGPVISVIEVESGIAFDDGTVRILAEPTDHAPVAPTVGYRFEAAGVSAALAGDTVPCEGLDRLVQGADVYVQTVIRRQLVEQVPLQRFLDILDYHSTTETAAQTAAKGGVKQLVFTHLVPQPAPGTEQDWLDDAAAYFDGTVHMAVDLFSLTV